MVRALKFTGTKLNTNNCNVNFESSTLDAIELALTATCLCTQLILSSFDLA